MSYHTYNIDNLLNSLKCVVLMVIIRIVSLYILIDRNIKQIVIYNFQVHSIKAFVRIKNF